MYASDIVCDLAGRGLQQKLGLQGNRFASAPRELNVAGQLIAWHDAHNEEDIRKYIVFIESLSPTF